jgi:hypothetical protein
MTYFAPIETKILLGVHHCDETLNVIVLAYDDMSFTYDMRFYFFTMTRP